MCFYSKKISVYLSFLPGLDGVAVVAAARELVNHDLLLLVLNLDGAVALLQDEPGLVGEAGRLRADHALQVLLPLPVVLQPQGVELAQDLLNVLVAPKIVKHGFVSSDFSTGDFKKFLKQGCKFAFIFGGSGSSYSSQCGSGSSSFFHGPGSSLKNCVTN